jgi:hypothetical protein
MQISKLETPRRIEIYATESLFKKYRRAPVSTASVSVVLVIRGLPRPHKKKVEN